MSNEIPNKDHDPAEDGVKMAQQVNTAFAMPWPRKPLSGRAHEPVKQALDRIRNEFKERKRGKPYRRQKSNQFLSDLWD